MPVVWLLPLRAHGGTSGESMLCASALSCEEAAPIQVEEVRAAIQEYPRGKAPGLDDWCLCSWRHLPQAGLEDLTRLLNKLFWQEWTGWMTAIVLLPKPGSGCRPVALTTSLLRLWSKLMLSHARRWEQQVNQDFHYGRSGRTCVQAAVHFSLRSQLSRLDGEHAVGISLDLQKAFERVSFASLARAAQSYGFPLFVLRGALQLYGLPRVLLVSNRPAPRFTSWGGVLPGCSLATTMMKLCLLPLWVLVLEQTHGIVRSLSNVVDDIFFLLTSRLPLELVERATNLARGVAEWLTME
eukprot:4649963-Amphidinium_carterae.1